MTAPVTFATVGTQAEQPDLGPGLHVQSDAEPPTRALHLAAELGGDLCATLLQADELLAELRAYPPLTADDVGMLPGLTDRLTAAQRIAERTLARAAHDVGERLAAKGSGVAIHPRAVRDRGAAVVAARAALAELEERLRAAEAAEETDVAAAEADPPSPAPGPSQVASFQDEPPARRRWSFFGFGRKRRARRHKEETSESTSLLQQVAATTDAVFGARRAQEVRHDQLVMLRAQRDRAQEEQRVAERAWHDLVGEDSVEEVEAVVRRFDPQHHDALVVAQQTVGVRAVSTLLQRAEQRWEAIWRDHGFDPPPEVDQEALDRMVERLVRPVVLVSAAIERADEIALGAPAAPVVVLEQSVS